MFRVDVDSLEAYFDFDPKRKPDLVKLDRVIRKSAPTLKRHFHAGTPAGSAGMRMKMIGYGRFQYAIKSGKTSPWPVVGLALQKNYISVYVAVRKNGRPLVQGYAEGLGALRNGNNNFSFETFDELNAAELSKLFADAASIFRSDPDNPVRYMQGEKSMMRKGVKRFSTRQTRSVCAEIMLNPEKTGAKSCQRYIPAVASAARSATRSRPTSPR